MGTTNFDQPYCTFSKSVDGSKIYCKFQMGRFENKDKTSCRLAQKGGAYSSATTIKKSNLTDIITKNGRYDIVNIYDDGFELTHNDQPNNNQQNPYLTIGYKKKELSLNFSKKAGEIITNISNRIPKRNNANKLFSFDSDAPTTIYSSMQHRVQSTEKPNCNFTINENFFTNPVLYEGSNILVCGSDHFNNFEKRLLKEKEKEGLYVWIFNNVDGNNHLYVGKTINARSRAEKHMKKTDWTDPTKTNIEEIVDLEEIVVLEEPKKLFVPIGYIFMPQPPTTNDRFNLKNVENNVIRQLDGAGFPMFNTDMKRTPLPPNDKKHVDFMINAINDAYCVS